MKSAPVVNVLPATPPTNAQTPPTSSALLKEFHLDTSHLPSTSSRSTSPIRTAPSPVKSSQFNVVAGAPLPLFSITKSSSKLNVILNQIIRLIVRDGIVTWYAPLCGHPDAGLSAPDDVTMTDENGQIKENSYIVDAHYAAQFPLRVASCLVHVFRQLESRSLRVDWFSLFLHDIPRLYYRHIVDMKRIRLQHGTIFSSREGADGLSPVTFSEAVLESWPHHSLRPETTPLKDRNYCAAMYWRHISQVIALALLPKKERRHPLIREICADIMSSVVFVPSIEMLAEPYFIFWSIESLAKSLTMPPPKRKRAAGPAASSTANVQGNSVSFIWAWIKFYFVRFMFVMRALFLILLPLQTPWRDTRLRGEDASQPVASWEREGLDGPWWICLVNLVESDDAFETSSSILDTWRVRLLKHVVRPVARALVGGSMDRLIVDFLVSQLSPEALVVQLTTMRDSVWPNGQLNTAPVVIYTLEQRQEAAERAMEALKALTPYSIQLLLGSKLLDHGFQRFIQSFSNSTSNRRLIVALFDLILGALIPELLDGGKSLLSRANESEVAPLNADLDLARALLDAQQDHLPRNVIQCPSCQSQDMSGQDASCLACGRMWCRTCWQKATSGSVSSSSDSSLILYCTKCYLNGGACGCPDPRWMCRDCVLRGS